MPATEGHTDGPGDPGLQQLRDAGVQGPCLCSPLTMRLRNFLFFFGSIFWVEVLLQVKRVNSLARREKSCFVGSEHCMLDCGGVETILESWTRANRSRPGPRPAPASTRQAGPVSEPERDVHEATCVVHSVQETKSITVALQKTNHPEP